MRGAIEIPMNWVYVIIGIIITLIVSLIIYAKFFGSPVFSATAKEMCLLTIGKLFGRAELCEVFI